MEVFECPICKGPHRWDRTLVEDDRYRGDHNHCVHIRHQDGTEDVYWGDELCFDCYSIHWFIDDAQFRGADKYTKLAFLLCKGWKQTEIARAMGVHRNTISNWRKVLRKNFSLYQQIVVQIG